MKKIIRNRIKCKKCGEIIESTSRHDFKFCKMRCGRCRWRKKITFEESENKDDYERTDRVRRQR